MEFNEARRYVKDHTREILDIILPAAKVRGQWVCPVCSHGANGDGLSVNPKSRDGNGLHCFGCNFSGDVIDILNMFLFGSRRSSCLEAVRRGADLLGFAVDPVLPAGAKEAKNSSSAGKTAKAAEPRNANAAQTDQTGADEAQPSSAEPGAGSTDGFMAYYQECRQRLKDPRAVEYLQSRGISVETAELYWTGFDPQADPAGAPGALAADNVCRRHPSPRLICPTTAFHYVARSTDPACPKQYQKLNPKGSGSVGIFNLKALDQNPDSVFVTEGFFNALSFLEAGACAIATNSASNRAALINALKDRRPETTLILAFDNDEAGRRATAEVRAELRRLNIPFLLADEDITGRGDKCPDGSREDANDLLVKDRSAFAKAVARMQRQTAPKPDNGATYLDTLLYEDIVARREVIPTGFPKLDELCGGGLHAGLYVIGAISSLGKTTFTAQLADQVAENGHDVLFFSLEMSQLELRAKSLSRLTWLMNPAGAVTSAAVGSGRWTDIVYQAIEAYKELIGDRVSVIEGSFRCDLSFIGDYVRTYIRRNAGGSGARPVVVADYLQILQPSQDAQMQTARQTVDACVTELKRLSRELGIPVVVISSINRTNYTRPVDFEAFKESGGIEYTADVVLGMQLSCLREAVFARKDNITEQRRRIREAKEEMPRKIELVCLKNRYGKSGFSCFFDYYPAYDCFREAASDAAGDSSSF